MNQTPEPAPFGPRLRWAIQRFWARWPIRTGPRARLGIAAIIRNEGPYLLEWIAWHRCLGVRDFFIADNTSTDGTTEVLRALHAAGLITCLDFPGTPGAPPQLPAYLRIVAMFGRSVEWMTFIDADEFIWPSAARHWSRTALPVWLGRMPKSVGSVALNWAIYGASGRVSPGSGLVVDRFTRRAEQAFAENTHTKSIIRCRDWQGVLETPHGFAISETSDYVDSDIRPLGEGEPGRGRTAHVVWGAFRLNHYAVKSRAEFIHKKVARGRPDTFAKEHARDDAYFALYDDNSVSDPPDPRFVRRVKAEMALIRKSLTGLTAAQRDLDLEVAAIGG